MKKQLDLGFVNKGAEISECGKYRYKLWRVWDNSKPLVLWVMHNPSKANEVDTDPTITRIINFSKSWGYGGIYVGNLSPYRATNPDDLKGLSWDELVPILNFDAILEMERLCDLIVFAYGVPVKQLRKGCWLDGGHYLRLTKGGYPEHPLYLKSDLKPIPW